MKGTILVVRVQQFGDEDNRRRRDEIWHVKSVLADRREQDGARIALEWKAADLNVSIN